MKNKIVRSDFIDLKKEKTTNFFNKHAFKLFAFINWITLKKFDKELGELYGKIYMFLLLRSIK